MFWRRLLGAALLLALGFAGGVVFASAGDAPWHAMTGEDWRAMEPKERTAFLNGFLSGSGLADAEATGARDSLALMRAITDVRRGGQLRFPYSPSVYDARVSDHYVWENHRSQPLWYGLWEVNGHLRAAVGDTLR